MPVVMIDTSKTHWEGDFDTVQSILRNFTNSKWDYENKKYLVDAEGAKEITDDLYNSRLIVASYTHESYEGSAFVLYEKGGKYFEVSAGHCSCNGLEEQWSPSEVTLKELVNHRKYGIPEMAQKYIKELYDGTQVADGVLQGESDGS